MVSWSCIVRLGVAAAFLFTCFARDHIVGDSMWAIPPTDDFYAEWSTKNNRTFTAGDNLVFGFETGFYNVMQVSRREYESCTAENPFRVFVLGPAVVPLREDGMHYFMCSFGNYCSLGLKLAVAVLRPLP